MTSKQKEQIIAALEWAEGKRDRSAEAKFSFGDTLNLFVYESRNGGVYVKIKEEAETLDFSAMIDVAEREKDEKELARLQAKLCE